jgi:hypothetical protein
MRRCSRCKEEKPGEDFAWRNIEKGWRETYCRPCRAAYKQEHYAKNKQRYIDQARSWSQSTLAERGELLLTFFASHPCTDCGEADPIVLEFDHVLSKDFDIGAGFRNKSWDDVAREMAKCEVVCVNCHRRRTAKRSGSARLRAAQRHGDK